MSQPLAPKTPYGCGHIQYPCAFQTLYQQKISRRMLLLNCAVLPLAFDSIQCST